MSKPETEVIDPELHKKFMRMFGSFEPVKYKNELMGSYASSKRKYHDNKYKVRKKQSR